MKTAILADLHLPDRTDTLKEKILDASLAAIVAGRVDLILGGGDMTGFGTPAAAERLAGKLRRTGIPFLLTPGNAEYRSGAETAGQIAGILRTDTVRGRFVMLNSALNKLDDEARAQLQKLPGHAVIVTHTPPSYWPESDRALLAEHEADYDLLIAGHVHRDSVNGKVRTVRGMDPDKAIGGPPAVMILEDLPDGGFRFSELEIPGLELADIRRWNEADRRAFFAGIGISGMNIPLETLEFAAKEHISVFELRHSSLDEVGEDALKPALARWREAGGKILSLHLPDLGWKDGALSGSEAAARCIRSAAALGCDRLTLHVPKMSVNDAADPAVREAVLAETARRIDEANAAGMVVGIENMHMRKAEKPDGFRRYGYTCEECRAWIAELRARVSRPEMTGFHFDIGHARNNAPYSSIEPVGTWLADLGPEMNAMHLHQVEKLPAGGFDNHRPLLTLFGPLISLSSLFAAWKTGRVGRIPMILEIRGGLGPESWETLRRLILPEEDGHSPA